MVDHYKKIEKPRRTELTAVTNRTLFDDPPGDLVDESDLNRWNHFRVKYHNAHNLYEHDYPLQVDFELTSLCDMRCSFCTHAYQIVKQQDLGFDQFRSIIDEAKTWGLCSIKLNYINEPLLTPDIDRYIAYAKSHGILNVYFATNGTLLTEMMSHKLIDVKLSKLMVSLDAFTSDTFRKMRQSDKYHLIIDNINTFLEVRKRRNVTYPLLRVNFLNTKVNRHERREFEKYWSDRADMIGVQEQVGLPDVDNDYSTADIQRDLTEFQCSFPFKMLVIDHSGEILPCCTFSGRKMSLGNVSVMSLKDAWDSKKMQDLKQLHREAKYRENPICKKCVGGCS